MKRLSMLIVLIPCCVLLAFWAWAYRLRRTYGEREWPDHLGTIEEAPKHFTHDPPNAAGLLLAKMAEPFAKSPQAVTDYVYAQIRRTAVDVEPPPAEVAEYLRGQSAQLDVVRDHIMHAGAISTNDARPQIALTDLFIARALTTGSWEDLQAAWMIDRPLWNRHETYFIGFRLTRLLHAAAAKMPVPAPAWFDELRTFDYKHRFAAAAQLQVWDSRRAIEEMIREHPLLGLIDGWRAIAMDADFSEQLRVRTGELLAMKSCDYEHDPLSVKPMNVASWNYLGRAFQVMKFMEWSNVARYRAELEATEKAHILRAGQIPPAASQCSDGTWIVTPQSIKFSRAIGKSRYPLAHEVK